jgi:hypothetical protein
LVHLNVHSIFSCLVVYESYRTLSRSLTDCIGHSFLLVVVVVFLGQVYTWGHKYLANSCTLVLINSLKANIIQVC